MIIIIIVIIIIITSIIVVINIIVIIIIMIMNMTMIINVSILINITYYCEFFPRWEVPQRWSRRLWTASPTPSPPRGHGSSPRQGSVCPIGV